MHLSTLRVWAEARFFRKTSTANLQLDSLDGLRGVAVLFVVLAHLANRGNWVLVDLAGAGTYGVYLFFVLSAFLLTLPFLALRPVELANGSRWLRYGLRRLLRIFPLYVVVLVASWLLTGGPGAKYVIPLTTAELMAHLSLRAGKIVFWTIPVECTYYLVLPLVVAIIVVVLRDELFAVVLVAAAAIGVTSRMWPATADESTALLPYLPVFLCGSVAACVHRAIARYQPVTRRSAIVLEVLAMASFAGVVAMVPSTWAWLTGTAVPRDAFHGEVVLFGLLWATFVVAELNGIGLARRLLENRLLRFIGIVSFSMYLWHLSVIAIAVRGFDLRGEGAVAWVLAVSVVAAAASYLAFERPFILGRVATALRAQLTQDRR